MVLGALKLNSYMNKTVEIASINCNKICLWGDYSWRFVFVIWLTVR